MNFDYLQRFSDLKKLYEYCAEAEEFVLYKPNISAAAARKAIEYIVKMIYTSLVEEDAARTVFEMTQDVRFTSYLNDPTLLNTIHYIRKLGNVAVHDGTVTRAEARKVLEELHFLVGEFCILLGLVEDYPEFVPPQTAANPPINPPAVPDQKAVTVEPAVAAKFAPRMRQTIFNVAFRRDEAENKKLYLMASLREAGWPIVDQENQALPGCAGVRMQLDGGTCADYILYGRDSRPLAVVEYTLTSQNIVAGRQLGI